MNPRSIPIQRRSTQIPPSSIPYRDEKVLGACIFRKNRAEVDERAIAPSPNGKAAAENVKAVRDERECPAESKSTETRSVLELLAIKPLKTPSSHPEAGLSP
jgi:hypothetical protein